MATMGIHTRMKWKRIWEKLEPARHHLGNVAYWAILYGYAFLYMYTAVSKLGTIEVFTEGITYTPILGRYAELIGWGIPVIELILAVALIVPWAPLQRVAIKISTVLMGIFCLYLAVMMLFAETKLCHCGGVIESLSWPQHLLFNLAWLIIGIWATWKKK